MRLPLRYIALTLLGILMSIPFLWMISTSLKSPDTLVEFPPRFLPASLQLNSYTEVSERIPLGLFFWNSLYIAVLGTIGELFAAALAAYAFARFEFKWKRVLFAVLLAAMMVPFQVTMIPVFVLFKTLGVLDTHTALILPHFFGGAFASAAFGIFFLRQFFEQIPQELEDAARVDGAGHFRILWRVMLPLSKPALTVLALFTFMAIWNDLLSPVLFLSSEDKMTLPFGLASLQMAQHLNRYDLLMAGTLISVAPIILLYIICQRWVTDAFLSSGVKG